MGGFTFIIPLPKPHAVALFPIYLHYWLASTAGDSVASSGTGKATKVIRRPLGQIAFSTIHQLLLAASLPIRGRTGLSLQLHTPYLVSASMRIDWAPTGPTRWVCWEGSISGTRAGKGDASPTLRLPVFWFTMKKVPRNTIIFGKEHVNQCTRARRQGVSFGFTRTTDTQKVDKPIQQLAHTPTPCHQGQPPDSSNSLGVLRLLLHLVQTSHPVLYM